jgi:sucrose phosphorylase
MNQNKNFYGVSLMTYPDSLGGNLVTLYEILEERFSGCFNSIHILPPYKSSADRGFAPLTHFEIEPRFGNWSNIVKLSKKYDLILDLISGHISKESFQFQDFLKNGKDSKYFNYFLHFRDIYNDGVVSEQEIIEISKLLPRNPLYARETSNGQKHLMFSTFLPDQVDLNFQNSNVWKMLNEYADFITSKGVKMLRLDAISTIYKSRKDGLYSQENTLKLLNHYSEHIVKNKAVMLTEAKFDTDFYKQVYKMGEYSYDFHLIDCLFDSIFNLDCSSLVDWANVKFLHFPNQINVLTNHDGIVFGLNKEFVSENKKNSFYEKLYNKNKDILEEFSGTKANNVSNDSLNITLFDAFGRDKKRWFIAHIIYLFLPGTPQFYYNDLFMAKTSKNLFYQTGEGRSVLRPNYNKHEVEKCLNQTQVKNLIKIIRLRNLNLKEIFIGGKFQALKLTRHKFILTWRNFSDQLEVLINLRTQIYEIKINEEIL